MTPEEAIDVRQFLESRNKYLADIFFDVSSLDYWVRDRTALDPRFPAKLAEYCRELLAQGDVQFLRVALKSLAVAGRVDDCQLISNYSHSPIPTVAEDARISAKFLQRRFKTLPELRSEVNDQESFIAFAHALIDDRERKEPPRDGVLEVRSERPQEHWQNNCISDYLAAALTYFSRGEQEWEQVTWEDLAAFFDSGRTSLSHNGISSSSDAALASDVTDYDSFVAFVCALIVDRRRAESLELENPQDWALAPRKAGRTAASQIFSLRPCFTSTLLKS